MLFSLLSLKISQAQARMTWEVMDFPCAHFTITAMPVPHVRLEGIEKNAFLVRGLRSMTSCA